MSEAGPIAHEAFSCGDVVTHPMRPQWGEGTIHQATLVVHQGRRAQRLVIGFTNHGRVTINTAVAPVKMELIRKASGVNMANSRSTASAVQDGFLGSFNRTDRNGDRGRLTALPELMTDPFAGMASRIRATLDNHRYCADPRNPRLPSSARNLLDWAIAQTGLADPLSVFTRHELEEAFTHYVRDRNQHLVKLVGEAKKMGKLDVLHQILNQTEHPSARSALARAIRGAR